MLDTFRIAIQLLKEGTADSFYHLKISRLEDITEKTGFDKNSPHIEVTRTPGLEDVRVVSPKHGINEYICTFETAKRRPLVEAVAPESLLTNPADVADFGLRSVTGILALIPASHRNQFSLGNGLGAVGATLAAGVAMDTTLFKDVPISEPTLLIDTLAPVLLFPLLKRPISGAAACTALRAACRYFDKHEYDTRKTELSLNWEEAKKRAQGRIEGAIMSPLDNK